MGNAGIMENRRVAVARCLGGLALATKRRPEKALDPERERERRLLAAYAHRHPKYRRRQKQEKQRERRRRQDE